MWYPSMGITMAWSSSWSSSEPPRRAVTISALVDFPLPGMPTKPTRKGRLGLLRRCIRSKISATAGSHVTTRLAAIFPVAGFMYRLAETAASRCSSMVTWESSSCIVSMMSPASSSLEVSMPSSCVTASVWMTTWTTSSSSMSTGGSSAPSSSPPSSKNSATSSACCSRNSNASCTFPATKSSIPSRAFSTSSITTMSARGVSNNDQNSCSPDDGDGNVLRRRVLLREGTCP
mmetsp:Transcript_11447/g.26982  ORF Transcript_11447/g.26982 Transcript_11447/m.26982 type:complete len:232 (+) Transcript_11447:604-1299(+)